MWTYKWISIGFIDEFTEFHLIGRGGFREGSVNCMAKKDFESPKKVRIPSPPPFPSVLRSKSPPLPLFPSLPPPPQHLPWLLPVLGLQFSKVEGSSCPTPARLCEGWVQPGAVVAESGFPLPAWSIPFAPLLPPPTCSVPTWEQAYHRRTCLPASSCCPRLSPAPAQPSWSSR